MLKKLNVKISEVTIAASEMVVSC